FTLIVAQLICWGDWKSEFTIASLSLSLVMLCSNSVCSACRTLLCKSKRGGLKDTYPDEILAPVLKLELEILSSDMYWDPAPKEQGNAEWLLFMLASLKLFQLGLRTVNRQRSSVLQAVADVAASIKPGFYDIGIGAGLESMTAYPMAWDGSVNPRRFGVTRKEQDQAAVSTNVVAGLLTGKDRSVKDTLGSGKEEGLRLILQLQCNVMNDQPQIRPRSDLTKGPSIFFISKVPDWFSDSQDSPDPLANSLLQPQFPGTLVLELDWLPVRTDKNDPLVLCITGADSSFRLVEVNIDKRAGYGAQSGSIKERFRPMPLCSPILLPTPHALALRLILQCGVKPSWFNTYSSIINKGNSQLSKSASSSGDLRSYLIDIPTIGDSVVPELLLKVLEPYQREGEVPGSILDDERAYFWLLLPRALKHLMNNLANKSLQKVSEISSSSDTDDASLLSRISSKGKSATSSSKRNTVSDGELRLMAFEQEELWESANERIPWHERLDDEEGIQNRVHELVSIGNLEAAVSLMLSTPPESPYLYPNALRAVALLSAVSRSLNELAVKVVAANMVETDRSLSGTHLLCAVGRYQEACSQLQDAGCWTDADPRPDSTSILNEKSALHHNYLKAPIKLFIAVQMVGVVKNVEKDRFRYQYRARIDCMKDIDIVIMEAIS
ncbi:transducin/WD40 repeat family protein, partial [Tanacetum coccineum]